MSHRLTQRDALKDRLSRYREIKISVTGRKSGRTISIPVWFVFEDDKLYLLPVSGSDTPVVQERAQEASIQIQARDAEAELKVIPVADVKPVASVVEKFRDKYAAGDVRKYSSKFDVAVIAAVQ
jgi:hypothetical protein